MCVSPSVTLINMHDDITTLLTDIIYIATVATMLLRAVTACCDTNAQLEAVSAIGTRTEQHRQERRVHTTAQGVSAVKCKD